MTRERKNELRRTAIRLRKLGWSYSAIQTCLFGLNPHKYGGRVQRLIKRK